MPRDKSPGVRVAGPVLGVVVAVAIIMIGLVIIRAPETAPDVLPYFLAVFVIGLLFLVVTRAQGKMAVEFPIPT